MTDEEINGGPDMTWLYEHTAGWLNTYVLKPFGLILYAIYEGDPPLPVKVVSVHLQRRMF